MNKLDQYISKVCLYQYDDLQKVLEIQDLVYNENLIPFKLYPNITPLQEQIDWINNQDAECKAARFLSHIIIAIRNKIKILNNERTNN